MIRRQNGTGAQTAPPAAKKTRSGAAIVEFAVIAPVLFLVMLGIIEFGRAFMVSQLVTNGTRDAARTAVVEGSTNAAVKQKLEQFLADTTGINAADVTVTITVDNPDAGNEVANAVAGDACTVEAVIPFSKVQYISAVFLGGKNLRSQATMRHE